MNKQTKASLLESGATLAPDFNPAAQAEIIILEEVAKKDFAVLRAEGRVELFAFARKTGARAAIAEKGLYNLYVKFAATVASGYADDGDAVEVYDAYSDGFARVVGSDTTVTEQSAASKAKQVSNLKVFASKTLVHFGREQFERHVKRAREELGNIKLDLSFAEAMVHSIRQMNKLVKGPVDAKGAAEAVSHNDIVGWLTSKAKAEAAGKGEGEGEAADGKPAPKTIEKRIDELVTAMERIRKELADDVAFAAIYASARAWRAERDAKAKAEAAQSEGKGE
jgi:hypothetical protein